MGVGGWWWSQRLVGHAQWAMTPACLPPCRCAAALQPAAVRPRACLQGHSLLAVRHGMRGHFVAQLVRSPHDVAVSGVAAVQAAAREPDGRQDGAGRGRAGRAEGRWTRCGPWITQQLAVRTPTPQTLASAESQGSAGPARTRSWGCGTRWGLSRQRRRAAGRTPGPMWRAGCRRPGRRCMERRGGGW